MPVSLDTLNQLRDCLRRDLQARPRRNLAELCELLRVIENLVNEWSDLKELPRRTWRDQRADHEVRINHQPHAAGPPARLAARRARHLLPSESPCRSPPVAARVADRTPRARHQS